MKGTLYLTLILTCLVILGIYIISAVFVNWNYEKVIGAYVENAYEVNTPQEMIAQIQLAEQGMLHEGLARDDYGAIIFTKPDNKMSWQYTYLDNFIQRAEAVEIWYNNTYSGKVQATESLGDVYEQKMDNLRQFLKEGGRADWIAEDTWYVKNHIIFYRPIMVSLIGVLLILAFVFLMIFANQNKEWI